MGRSTRASPTTKVSGLPWSVRSQPKRAGLVRPGVRFRNHPEAIDNYTLPFCTRTGTLPYHCALRLPRSEQGYEVEDKLA